MNNVCKLHRCYYFYFEGKGNLEQWRKFLLPKNFIYTINFSECFLHFGVGLIVNLLVVSDLR